MNNETLQKIAEWLAERDSHSIYLSPRLKEKFKEATGLDAPEWPEHTTGETARRINARGLGGYVDASEGELLCYGWEVAETLAHEYAGFQSRKMGRGFVFQDCLNAIEEKGKKNEIQSPIVDERRTQQAGEETSPTQG